MKNHLNREGRVSKCDLLEIINIFTNIVKKEPNLIAIQDPVTVVGDIHGQYYDFIKIFEIGGEPESTKYLFLGDYVDRGCFSIECLLIIYALKINFKENIITLRGNHECRQITSFFNFKLECKHLVYSLKVI